MKFWRCLRNNNVFFFFYYYFIPHYFKLHTLLGSLPHFLPHFFPLLLKLPPPPPLQVCGYVCAGSRLQQFSSAAQSAHERCGSLQRHHTGTAHLTFSLSHAPRAAGTLHTLVKLSRFILINGRKKISNLFEVRFWNVVVNASVMEWFFTFIFIYSQLIIL